MAWGCFCWIPCPYKKWREEDRRAMLTMLPLLGACLGVIDALLWLALGGLNAEPLLTAAVVTAFGLLLTGFIHLDGFMDCCDAVLPRHPDLKRRQEILKDSHTGAFAVIGLVLMLTVVLGAMTQLSENPVPAVVLVLPMVAAVSRGASVISVIAARPMGTSQYREMASQGTGAKAIPALILTLVLAAATALAAYIFGGTPAALVCLVSGGVCFASAMIIGAADRRALGGMNGDISGHMIGNGEMFGLLTAALLSGLV